MERNDLVDESDHRLRQLSGQGFGVSDNRGFQFEGLFAKMSLNDGVTGNMVSSSPRIRAGMDGYSAGGVGGDNLVPGVYGLGFGNVNNNVGSGTGTNDMLMMYRNNAYFNHPGPVAVGSPFGFVHGDLEAYYRSSFYQSEVQRAQMIECARRRTNSVLDVSWNGGHRLVAVDSRRAVNFMELRGQILGLAMTQYGCKMLQMRIGEIEEEEIGNNFSSLMMDQFGNYFIQKLIEVCNEKQRSRIIRSVTKHPYQLIRVCLNLHGTRAVQKLLECVTSEEQISMLISAIIPDVVPLIKDCNAYHVIQHCLKYFSDEHNRFLINEIARNCYEIATDKSGCCVVQLCVDITKGEVKQHLISQITANALQLSHDRYGNYVVQHLLLMKVPSVTASLVDELQGNFCSLACNKYGSNVVEKCLTETGNEFSELVILELLKTPGVSKLLQDPFGNYVFQSALSVSQGLLHNALVSLVDKHTAFMSSNLYGKKVLAWFDNRKRLGSMHKNMRSLIPNQSIQP